MSYLDVPRLHFFGTFTANPSTVNNDATNYEQLEPPFSPPPPSLDQGWNPDGDHTWAFVGCTVRTVTGDDGSPSQDPLVGTAVASTGTEPHSSPKLVDLDPEQQMVSTLFGLRIQIGDETSGWVTGTFQPQPFLDLTGTPSGGPGAYYQSILQDLTWSPQPASPALRELQKVSQYSLSIKFNLVQTAQGPPASGPITGTIDLPRVVKICCTSVAASASQRMRLMCLRRYSPSSIGDGGAARLMPAGRAPSR